MFRILPPSKCNIFPSKLSFTCQTESCRIWPTNQIANSLTRLGGNTIFTPKGPQTASLEQDESPVNQIPHPHHVVPTASAQKNAKSTCPSNKSSSFKIKRIISSSNSDKNETMLHFRNVSLRSPQCGGCDVHWSQNEWRPRNSCSSAVQTVQRVQVAFTFLAATRHHRMWAERHGENPHGICGSQERTIQATHEVVEYLLKQRLHSFHQWRILESHWVQWQWQYGKPCMNCARQSSLSWLCLLPSHWAAVLRPEIEIRKHSLEKRWSFNGAMCTLQLSMKHGLFRPQKQNP